MERYWVIARIVKERGKCLQTIGYKLYNLEVNRTCIITKEQLLEDIQNNRYEVVNVYQKDGVLKGKGGSLSRYTAIDVKTNQVIGNESAVILGVNKYHIYSVILRPSDKKPELIELSKYRLRFYAWQQNKQIVYANGVVIRNGDTFKELQVQPISGVFWQIPNKKHYIEHRFEYNSYKGINWFIRILKAGDVTYRGLKIKDGVYVELYQWMSDIEKYPLGKFITVLRLEDFESILNEKGTTRIKHNSRKEYFSLIPEMKLEMQVWLDSNKDLIYS